MGARTQPCSMPLSMSNGSEAVPLYITVPFMLTWKDLVMLRSFVGHLIFSRILKIPSLFTRSNAFVRSIKAMFRGTCCSFLFSWSWRIEKTISIVDRPALNHTGIHSIFVLQEPAVSFCNTLENSLPVIIEEKRTSNNIPGSKIS